MSAPRLLRSLGQFFVHLLYRDRYLTEVLTAFVTLGLGIISASRMSRMGESIFLTGFTTMPLPELWVVAFALPGLWVGARSCRRGYSDEACSTVIAMLTFVVLAAVSFVLDLDNWTLWTLLAFLIAFVQLYAIIMEGLDLRWGVAFMGLFFHGGLFLSILEVSPIVPYTHAYVGGFFAACLLSISRLAGRRAAWKS